MIDILLEVLRAFFVTLTVVYLWMNNGKQGISTHKGGCCLLIGFTLLLFGMLIDITDNFTALNRFVIIGDTPVQSFLEKFVGYLGGFMFIAMGFRQWLPSVTRLRETRNELEAAGANLERELLDRGRAEESLRKERDKLEAVCRNMGVGLVVISRKRGILWRNRLMDEIPCDLPHLCPEAALTELFEKGREPVPREQMVQDDQGNLFWYQVIMTPLKNREGVVTSALGVIVPVTERKVLEAKLLQVRKMESMGTIAGGIAHDFNNILGIIIGNTELALEEIPEQAPSHSHLMEISQAGNRAKEVVRHLLSIGRKTEMKEESVKIRSLVEETAGLLSPTLPPSMDIRLEIPEALPAINGDPVQLKAVLTHLCTNAFQSMEERGGTLTITADTRELHAWETPKFIELSPGTHLRLRVRDTGHGIDPEISGRIFDPYFTTKEVGNGSGMGLAVVHGIVKSHGGAVSVRSVPGKGTAVDILLPVARKAGAPEAPPGDFLPEGNERILFVDDEPSLVRLARKMLEHLGYRVTAETDSVRALGLFRDAPSDFDLVITDMTMPRMSGDELVKRILAVRQGMPIILCTGHSNRMDGETALKMGIRKYMEKPLNMGKLARGVREALDAPVQSEQGKGGLRSV